MTKHSFVQVYALGNGSLALVWRLSALAVLFSSLVAQGKGKNWEIRAMEVCLSMSMIPCGLVQGSSARKNELGTIHLDSVESKNRTFVRRLSPLASGTELI